MNKHNTYRRRCGNDVCVQKQNKGNVLLLLKGTELGSFLAGKRHSLIMVVLMLAVVVNVLGDDTQALRDTLSSLCSLNKEGKFASCCESYDISSVTLASSAARNCFLSSLSSTSGSITFLFVFKLYFRISQFSGNLKTKD